VHAERRHELAVAIGFWMVGGGEVGFITLTPRHRKGQGLRAVWGAVSHAWGKVTSGRGWHSDQERYGVVGFARLVEVTHGDNGWHVHIHALAFMRSALPGLRPDVQALGLSMFERWSAALVAKGLRAPVAAINGEPVGVEAHLVVSVDEAADRLSGYFTKGDYGGPVAAAESVAWEMQPADRKVSRRGNRTPFAILADVVVHGLADDLELWLEWEAVSKGKRQLTWSRGLRDALRLGVEASDQEIAARDLGGETVAVASGWDLVRMRAPEILGYEGLDIDTARTIVRRWLVDAGCELHDG
jgi:hypothetical protein